MTTILQARMPQHLEDMQLLFAEYLRWVCPKIYTEYKAVFEPEAMIVHDMETIDIFIPPKGNLFLAYEDRLIAGCACTRTIGHQVAELKRMYVRPTFRCKGIGRLLVQKSIEEVRTLGYAKYRLDSAGFMTDAHALYHSFGFKQISAYDGSEIPEEYPKHWVFMELQIDKS